MLDTKTALAERESYFDFLRVQNYCIIRKNGFFSVHLFPLFVKQGLSFCYIDRRFCFSVYFSDRCLAIYSEGGTPKCFLNAAVKWVGLAKPTA